MSTAAAESWIREHVTPVGPIETLHVEPWATVSRVPVSQGFVWFKACEPVQAFEPRLTAELAGRWPDRVVEVIAHDEERAWLLLADAGTAVRELGNPPELWLRALPPYAELQRGEVAHAHEHLANGVPDMRPAVLPDRYEDFLRHDLPLEREELIRLRKFTPRLAELCAELAAHGIAESVQHDDLHENNLYVAGEQLRVLDWGDASIAHPFASLGETFRFLEGVNELPPGDPWFARLRDAYLEPWGKGLVETFELALRVGAFALPIAWARQRDHMPEEARLEFDVWYPIVLRRAVARTAE